VLQVKPEILHRRTCDPGMLTLTSNNNKNNNYYNYKQQQKQQQQQQQQQHTLAKQLLH
jgi:hypothetical protein